MGLVPRFRLAGALGTALRNLVHVHPGALERSPADRAGQALYRELLHFKSSVQHDPRCSAAGVAAVDAARMRAAWWKDSPPLYHEATTPVAATDWLAAHPDLPGPFLCRLHLRQLSHVCAARACCGLTTASTPIRPSTGRTYQEIASARPGWDGLLERDKVNLLMLSLGSQYLIKAVEESGQWCEEYRDRTAVIFSRCEPIP